MPLDRSSQDLSADTVACMHELATNALKYGALTGPEGRLAVTWQLLSNDDRDSRLVLEWRESGVVIQRTTVASDKEGVWPPTD